MHLTHLKLQKVMFFAHAWNLGKYSKPLVGQTFEAWRYGPVVRVVYDQLKVYENRNIDTLLKRIDVNQGIMRVMEWKFDRDTEEILKNIFDYYANFYASDLVKLSHEPDGPWDKVWKKASADTVVGMYIPNESIRSWILDQGGAVIPIRH